MRGGDFTLQALDRLRLIRIVILVVKRQIVDPQLLKGKLRRRQLSVVGITAKTYR
jgi:hypothetical protein